MYTHNIRAKYELKCAQSTLYEEQREHRLTHALSYRMPRSLARLSWRSMMLCRISSTSCLNSLSSIREMEKSGSKKGGGNAAAMDLALKPEVTWDRGEMAERGVSRRLTVAQSSQLIYRESCWETSHQQSLKVTFTSSLNCQMSTFSLVREHKFELPCSSVSGSVVKEKDELILQMDCTKAFYL